MWFDDKIRKVDFFFSDGTHSHRGRYSTYTKKKIQLKDSRAKYGPKVAKCARDIYDKN